jgi:hypothetical protein
MSHVGDVLAAFANCASHFARTQDRFGDMSIVLGSSGSKSRAFSIHGVTCAVMLVVGLLLINAI